MKEVPDEAFDAFQKKMADLGSEFAIGHDIPRTWVTGGQTFVNGEITMMVFREQNFMTGGDGKIDMMIKNVASIVMPTTVAMEFYRLLGSSLGVTADE